MEEVYSDSSAFDGYRNATPSFQVLIRTSAGYYYHKKRRCFMITLILTFLGIVAIVITSLLYIFVFSEPVATTLLNSNETSLISTMKVSCKNNYSIDDKCPRITGIGEGDQVTILFGGVNEHDARINTIQLVPNINCSSLPRKLLRLDNHRKRPLPNFEEENGSQITHLCRNGDIITCSSVRTGFKCAIYHENKWETIETPKGAAGILENFGGVYVDTYLILRLQNKETVAYNEDTRKFSKVLTSHKFSEIADGCYATLNSTHFIQSGGKFNNKVLDAVYMVELDSDFKSFKYFFKRLRLQLKVTELPRLNVKRMYHGCNIGMINDRLSLIVAGGIGEDGNPLSSVEYLVFHEQMKSKPKTYSDSVVFADSNHDKNSITFEEGIQSVKNLLTQTVKQNNKEVSVKKWRMLPSMKIARSHFPTIMISDRTLTIVGGKCAAKDALNCNSIEILDTSTCEWGFDEQHLGGTRYSHNSAKISLTSCVEH